MDSLCCSLLLLRFIHFEVCSCDSFIIAVLRSPRYSSLLRERVVLIFCYERFCAGLRENRRARGLLVWCCWAPEYVQLYLYLMLTSCFRRWPCQLKLPPVSYEFRLLLILANTCDYQTLIFCKPSGYKMVTHCGLTCSAVGTQDMEQFHHPQMLPCSPPFPQPPTLTCQLLSTIVEQGGSPVLNLSGGIVLLHPVPGPWAATGL